MSLPATTSSFLSPVSDNIPPSDPTTCQVEIDPGKSYEAIIGSDGNKFEAFVIGKVQKDVTFPFLHVRAL
jgi:hypothetical protein